MALTARTPALVICDAQNDFIEDGGWFIESSNRPYRPEEKTQFYRACRTLIDTAHAAGVPVIYACTLLRADGLDSALSVKIDRRRGPGACLVDGTWGARVVDPLAPEPRDIVVRKTGHSAFRFTPLHRILRNIGADSLILAGGPLYTSVNATGRDAVAHGYMAFAVPEALYPVNYPHPEYLRMRTHTISLSEAEERLRKPSAFGSSYGYRPAAGWASLLPESCLLLIDLQNGFVRREGFLTGSHELRSAFAFREEDYRRLLANNVRLVNWARAAGVPVVNVRVVVRRDEADSALYADAQFSGNPVPNHCVEGDWNAEFAEEIAPTKDDIELVKQGHSAFGFTILDRMLVNLGVKQCIVTGGNIGGCLEETLRDGNELGYSMVAVHDAAYRPGDTRLELMADECEIVSTDEILAGNRNAVRDKAGLLSSLAK
ncbi:MAG: cysteine hydrolase [Betaproteobacteria bacterium]|nr:cysteine hydrolase [Betaproteobacteria bacterium]